MSQNKSEPLKEVVAYKDTPNWLNENLFYEFLEKEYQNFLKITKFMVQPAVKNGENYMTIMLRVIIELQLKDNANQKVSYMVKIQPALEKLQIVVKNCNIFQKEQLTYSKYIPAFESYYRKAGRNIQLAPRLLLPTGIHTEDDFLILEDLKTKGFKNYSRHLGLDLEHTKAVLQKLAQFHAASAHYFEENGPYPVLYDKCLSSEAVIFDRHHKKITQIFLENLDLYGHFGYLEKKLRVLSDTQPDPFQHKSNWSSNKFNVLNHGDCWTNNIMFQYDQQGQISETYLIDFQLSRFGSPAQDLIYFLLSSTNLTVKIKHFDRFIRYYHEQLVEHLQLLRYKSEIPSLRDIHMELFKHDSWVYRTISVVMPIVLCEQRDDANVDSLVNENNKEFKKFLYTNDLYVKNMNLLLPWLDNRGAFDI